MPTPFPVPDEPRDPASGGRFLTTRWTQTIEAARGPDPEAARAALEAFCTDYQAAIRGFLRRAGCSEDEARDLTQEFFRSAILAKWDGNRTVLHLARREIGRFRCFLGTAVRRFLADHRRARHAIKRGEDKTDSLDAAMEGGWEPPSKGDGEPGRDFDLEFARALLLRAAESLRHCDQNLALLMRRKSQAEVAAELGLSEGAVKKMHHDFRRRLAVAIREEVHRTVGPATDDLEEELRYLQSLFPRLQ